MHIGVDLEQFLRDPYATGIQRVLQYLAKEWPVDEVQADFVLPSADGYALLTPAQAAELLTIPFLQREPDADLRGIVLAHLEGLDAPRVRMGDLLSIYDGWLLPEVSYLPSVLERWDTFARCMPAAMVGYDALPMSHPGNYRFVPGAASWVSEYFRRLATADNVVCISSWARDSILDRLRRDRRLPISIAHPGGDHLSPRPGHPPERVRFARLGTLEARKQPVEILRAFTDAVDAGLEADLLFVGNRSASDESINAAVRGAGEAGYPVTWIEGASDEQCYDLVNTSSAFLSIGVEGYGIPVLEAIRLGTPVLFDGIQPAGDLMVGRGARQIDAGDQVAMAAAFRAYGEPGALRDLAAEADPEGVPRWADFARAVAHSLDPDDRA